MDICVYQYICIGMYVALRVWALYVCKGFCMHASMYVCMYVCMYVRIPKGFPLWSKSDAHQQPPNYPYPYPPPPPSAPWLKFDNWTATAAPLPAASCVSKIHHQTLPTQFAALKLLHHHTWAGSQKCNQESTRPRGELGQNKSLGHAACPGAIHGLASRRGRHGLAARQGAVGHCPST